MSESKINVETFRQRCFRALPWGLRLDKGLDQLVAYVDATARLEEHASSHCADEACGVYVGFRKKREQAETAVWPYTDESEAQ